MKIKNLYIRQFVYGFTFLGMYLIAPLFFTYSAKRRAKVRSKKKGFLWLFLNDTKKSSPNDIDYGDYGRFKHNWFGAIQQNLLRNSHWNFKINYLLPNIGITENVKGNMTLCNKTIFGFNRATYEVGVRSISDFLLLKRFCFSISM
jgi:hypothetical protein